MIKLIKRLTRLLGNSNVVINITCSPLLISKINKKNEDIRFVFFMAALMGSLTFALPLITFLFFHDFERSLFMFIIGIVIDTELLIIAIHLRLIQGDTILIKKDGIEELNWLRSHFIFWNEIRRVYFNELGPKSAIYGRKLFPKSNRNYPVISIEGKQYKITIRAYQPELLQIKELIRSNYHGKVIEKIIEPLYRRLFLLLIGILLSSVLYFFLRILRKL